MMFIAFENLTGQGQDILISILLDFSLDVLFRPRKKICKICFFVSLPFNWKSPHVPSLHYHPVQTSLHIGAQDGRAHAVLRMSLRWFVHVMLRFYLNVPTVYVTCSVCCVEFATLYAFLSMQPCNA